MNASDLRKRTRREKEPCYICGKYELVCEWHHVIPLDEAARILSSGVHEAIETPLVSLYPTHHALIHKYLSGSEPDCCVALAQVLEDGGKKARKVLLDRVNRLIQMGEAEMAFRWTDGS